MVIGAQVFRYYPYVAGEYLPEGTELLQITSDPGLAEPHRSATASSVMPDGVREAGRRGERRARPSRACPAGSQRALRVSRLAADAD